MKIRTFDFWIYVMTNPGMRVLYTGVTNDLVRRMAEHTEAALNGSRTFTGKYNVRHVIYFEYFSHIDDAIGREKEIKGWGRKKKESLIAQANPSWIFLDEMIRTGEVDIALPLRLV
ncbi:MAG: GIY-YIG nuclease family protein [Flavobacteriales bacterium]|nr:GIY-YIG nuclease family protein [Flavobacteriales bacterium]